MKKYNFLNTLTLLFFMLLLSACKKENRCDCIKRTGTIISETREINGFDKIYLEDNLKVYITQGTAFNLKVEGGENIVPLIETKVTEGTLIIRNNNRCNWTRSYDKPLAVHITMPVIKYITSDGTNDIIGLNTITTAEFDVQTKNAGNIELWLDNSKVISHMHGSGDITLHGKTFEHACDIGGTSFLRCADLQTNVTWVHTFTTGLCYVNATHITCLIDNVGDVYCYGNPVTVEKVQKGQGQLYIK